VKHGDASFNRRCFAAGRGDGCHRLSGLLMLSLLADLVAIRREL
jgi:hypothetical protein